MFLQLSANFLLALTFAINFFVLSWLDPTPSYLYFTLLSFETLSNLLLIYSLCQIAQVQELYQSSERRSSVITDLTNEDEMVSERSGIEGISYAPSNSNDLNSSCHDDNSPTTEHLVESPQSDHLHYLSNQMLV